MAHLPRWDRAEPGGSYSRGWGFFRVHWEAKEHEPGMIRLHVEAAKQSVDPGLSKLKRDVIDAILLAGVRELAQRNGFGCWVGGRVSNAAHDKCTTVFKVVIPEEKRGDHEHNLRVVHRAMGTCIDRVITGFSAVLDDRFGSPRP
jgi:hypothetical protein